MANKQRIFLVTSLAGGGRSTFLRSLEDIGFHCIDHLPISLVQSVIDHHKTDKHYSASPGLALGIDIKAAEDAQEFEALHEKLKSKTELSVVYVSAEEDIVLQRYSETRRRHPLLDSKSKSLKDAIVLEKKLLKPVRDVANIFIDTSNWSPHAMARYAEAHFATASEKRKLAINVISFGFKKGTARPLDCLFDVRFLSNPYFKPNLRPLTGLDSQVQEFIQGDEKWPVFFSKIVDLMKTTIPYYYEEGKHYLHIGVGCTGGQHRSVFTAEKLADEIRKIKDTPISVSVEHRDISK